MFIDLENALKDFLVTYEHGIPDDLRREHGIGTGGAEDEGLARSKGVKNKKRDEEKLS